MFEDEELKEIDDTLSSKEADAFAKELAREAKKKKDLKPRKHRSYRKCTAGQCQRKPTHSVVRVCASVEGETINFLEKLSLIHISEPTRPRLL